MSDSLQSNKPTEQPEIKPDRNRDHITSAAQACLDHVRKIRWGTATAGYEVDDGDVRISVNIQVNAIGKAENLGKTEKKAT